MTVIYVDNTGGMGPGWEQGQASYQQSPSTWVESIDITINDSGYIDMEPHQNQDASIATRYKTAKMMNGRLFVANVMLDPDDTREIHSNWIMFSEIGKPDIMDIGEGEITKIDELAGNLVAFSTNSIYRLNVPSYDPLQWSLMEAVQSIGCSAIDGVLTIKGQMFFCSPEAMYMMDANFILI